MAGLVLAMVAGFPLASPAAPVHQVPERPESIVRLGGGEWLVDFGRVTFGNLELEPPAEMEGKVVVRFGEAFKNGRIDRHPPGSVRFAEVAVDLAPDEPRPLRVAPPADRRNTKQPEAVLTPPDWGVVLPFRWVEIDGWKGDLKPDQIRRQSAFSSTWDDGAASFHSSEPALDRIWELCRHSIKATTFAGIYVDGDRERIPYEADAYLNQLSHYYTDDDIQMARDTFDHLMEHPTWPSEWAPHLVFMAHADWMRTGDSGWLGARYDLLKSKLLTERVGPDGLVHSNARQQSWNDIIDWPEAERDGYVRTGVNTVVNAFHIAALRQMADLARAVGRGDEAEDFARQAERKRAIFNREFYDKSKGAYHDGLGTRHTALHASLFPLAFGLVPEEEEKRVADFVEERGMRCSVYAAQYLLEGLFRAGRGGAALDLILADGDRSWRHMLDSGTTMTWEAWDQKYKPNQDWNHAWGAAPANLLPRFVLGVQAAEPGWRTALVQPHPGGLSSAGGRVPTPRGPIEVEWKRRRGTFGLKLDLPGGMKAEVRLPAGPASRRVLVNGAEMPARRQGPWLVLGQAIEGKNTLIVR
ncbi:bifunctional sulfatase/alpha-L-rhamnosidase [Haloferula sargassicola]|uniref:alpha-L-rhamnosidase n=2 Tax=Haloferula sargassicola TaxID=490096 RepID=A0ABP9UIL5_9BACT